MAVSADGKYYGVATGPNDNGYLYQAGADGTSSTLYEFQTLDTSTSPWTNNDGAYPQSIIVAKDGSLYGVADYGGAQGNGTIFRYSASGGFSVVHTFSALNWSSTTGSDVNADGAKPVCVIQAPDSTLYGVASQGGAFGGGTVFKLSSDGTLTTIYSFQSQYPNIDGVGATCPTVGSDGNLYGAAGIPDSQYPLPQIGGSTAVYRLTPAGDFSVVHQAALALHNSRPPQGLAFRTPLATGADGAVYGCQTTYPRRGAVTSQIYRVTSQGDYKLLSTFPAGGVGANAGCVSLLPGTDGSLYAYDTGYESADYPFMGSVYKVASSGAISQVFNFAQQGPGWGNLPDGAGLDALALDTQGRLVAVTSSGTIDRIVPNGDMKLHATMTPAGLVAIGTTITVSWKSSGATSCAFVGDPAPDSGLLGPQPPSGSITYTSTLGNNGYGYSFALDCNDATGGVIRAPLLLIQ
jgi:uncharacterized repeat protein (TIGR03803 family)